MDEREWTIDLSKRAENNIDQILLYISQDKSLLQAQTFLREFYSKIENLKLFPRMYPKFPDVEDPNIHHFIFKNYRIVYQLIEHEHIIRILTIFHSRQQLRL